MRRPTSFFPVGVCAASLMVLGPWLSFSVPRLSAAADAPDAPEIVQRYEQILERAPMGGASLDRLVEIYQKGDGMDKLAQRWSKLATEPGDKAATYGLLSGILADQTGRGDDARRWLEAATKALPDDFHAWLALGDADTHQGRWADAVAAMQKALATKVAGEDRLLVFRKLGHAQERNLDLTGRPRDLATDGGRFPHRPVRDRGGRHRGTRRQPVRRRPQDLPATRHHLRGRQHGPRAGPHARGRGGRPPGQHRGRRPRLRGDPPLTAESSWLNRELRAQIEQIFRRDDDLVGLVAYYQRWNRDNPKDVSALLLLSAALGELNRRTEALEALRQAVALAPERHEVRESLGQGLVETGQFDEAITRQLTLTADDPTEPRYWETLGEAYWRKTQPATLASKKQALDAWQHLAPPGSKDAAAFLSMSDLLLRHKLLDEAVAASQNALALTPDAADIREKTVKLLLEQKKTDEAWKTLDALVAGDRATGANFAKLAALQVQFHREQEAEASIQKGLETDPKNFELLIMRWDRFAAVEKWGEAAAMFDRLMAAAPDSYRAEEVETRQLKALGLSGQMDETVRRLQDRLANGPALTESELRMLLRIMIDRADGTTPAVFAEAHRLFPQSVSLLRLESDFETRLGDYDAAVATLQKLAAADPAQKSNWLAAIVKIRQDQGNLDEALRVADQIIANAPSSASGYLSYAEIAIAGGKPEVGIARLQDGVKVVERPNELRLRLARQYLEAGQAAKARSIYDEAFNAAEDASQRMAIVTAMIPAYVQDGRIADLVARFKQDQKGEDEGGGKFSTYLAAIYEQNEDYAAARHELAKALAARPHDIPLLRSLINLANKEGALEDVLRYREMLAAADPGDDNQIALATEYAQQNRPDDAWRIMQANLAAVMKDPLRWKDLIGQIGSQDYADQARNLLEEAVAAQGSGGFATRYALGQFQMQARNLAGARQTFWDILATALQAAATASTGAPSAGGVDPLALQLGANSSASIQNLPISAGLPAGIATGGLIFSAPQNIVQRSITLTPIQSNGLYQVQAQFIDATGRVVLTAGTTAPDQASALQFADSFAAGVPTSLRIMGSPGSPTVFSSVAGVNPQAVSALAAALQQAGANPPPGVSGIGITGATQVARLPAANSSSTASSFPPLAASQVPVNPLVGRVALGRAFLSEALQWLTPPASARGGRRGAAARPAGDPLRSAEGRRAPASPMPSRPPIRNRSATVP